MEPQLAVGGRTPKPKKLSALSAMIMRATMSVASAMMGPAMLGRMCRTRMRACDTPSARAACTYSWLLASMVLARVTRASVVHERPPRMTHSTISGATVPSTTQTFCSTMAMSRNGMDSTKSTKRMVLRSNQPLK
jgi:hypothetical protein